MSENRHMIPDIFVSPEVLDALNTSLHKHARAHQVPQANRRTQNKSTHELRHAINHGRIIKPSLFSVLLNALFSSVEKLPRPFLDLRVKRVAAYHFFGITGIIAACVLPLVLTWSLEFSLLATITLLVVSAVLTWGYIKLSKVITQKNAVVFFNYFLVLLAGQILVLRILNQPILVYMDIMILGVGMLFAFGRMGCFMAGCCYGKPSLWGIRYDKHHTKNGFPRLMRRVRLLPTQLFESAWLFMMILFSTALLVLANTPGIALTTFLILLALGRFISELYRGDPMRPYRHGLSQAQWTASTIMASTVILQTTGILPYQMWQSFILASFLILLIASIARSKYASLHALNSARHIHEIADLFESFQKGSLIPASTQKAVYLKKTSQNIQLSENWIPITGRGRLRHITLSSFDQHMRSKQALGLSRFIMSLCKQTGIHVLLSDSDNIYHLIYFMIEANE